MPPAPDTGFKEATTAQPEAVPDLPGPLPRPLFWLAVAALVVAGLGLGAASGFIAGVETGTIPFRIC